MTIASATSRISYTGDGATTAFAVPFYFAANADLVVYLQASSGTQTLQVLGTHYTLTGATLAAGGTCTFVTAPTSTTGAVVSIYRDPPITQATSYNNNDPFPAKAHELALDKLTTIGQRTRDLANRAIHIPEGESSATLTTLATAASRKNKLLGFDSNGGLIYPLGPTYVGSTATGVAHVDSRATAQVTTFAVSVTVIRTEGLATPGDGGGLSYVPGTISSPGAFQDGAGNYWGAVTSGGGGGIQAPGGRLTLTSGTPVMGTSVTAATTLYYAPFIGNLVPIVTSSVVQMYPFTASANDAIGLSIVLGANWAANTNYDVFVALNGTTVTLATGPSWAAGAVAGSNTVGSSVRGTGAGSTELQIASGLMTNKNTMTLRYANASTFSAAANAATYLGTVRTGSAGQVSFTFGTNAVGGGIANLYVWNAYNQVRVSTTVGDATVASWSYTTATIRASNNSANNRVNFLTGLAQGGIKADFFQGASVAAVIAAFARVGFALNSTTVFDAVGQINGVSATAVNSDWVSPSKAYLAQLGPNYISTTETGDGTNASTFFGLPSAGQSHGLTVSLDM